MADRPGQTYVIATLVAAGTGVIGVWLPWVGLRELAGGMVCYTGQATAGIQGYEPVAIALFVALAIGAILGRYRGRRPDVVLLGAGGLMFLWYANIFNNYWGSTCYTVQPGLYLVLLSSLLFGLIGASGLLTRRGKTDGIERPDT